MQTKTQSQCLWSWMAATQLSLSRSPPVALSFCPTDAVNFCDGYCCLTWPLTSKRRRGWMLGCLVRERKCSVMISTSHIKAGPEGGVGSGLTASGFSFHLWQMGAVRHSMWHCPLPTPLMLTTHTHTHTHRKVALIQFLLEFQTLARTINARQANLSKPH